ncbi:MAG: hypothetical protein AB7H81_03430 [Vicinamibacterales bacterium]
MTTPRRGRAVLLSLVVCAGLAACGKKGPPLAPLARVPSPPANPQAARVGDDVYVWFTVPSANISGQSPADVSAIDLYAVTATEPPSGEDLTDAAVKIGTYAVRPVLPPPPPVPEGGPAPPAIALPPGFAQGAVAVVRETLSPELRVATALPARTAQREPPADETVDELLPGPLVWPGDAALLRRFYFAVAVGPRSRRSAPSQVVSVPVDDASSAPMDLRIDYTEAGMTLAWAAPGNARPAQTEPAPDLLPSRPLLAPPPPTGYHVFEVPRAALPAPDPYSITLPAPLTPQPLGTTTFAVPGPVRYGEERCFVVRPTDAVAGAVVVGPASMPACVTPVDTFPPAPPGQLAAIAGVGVINLIWEPNAEADLAGYIVLRGVAPGDALQAITPTPIRETTYRDEAATPGVRYTYAVVAVDTASPQNVSGQSNRVEETSRTP